MSQPQAVIFDIGNVLIEWNPEAYFDRHMSAEARAQMFAETAIDQMNIELDRGAPFRQTVYDLAQRHPAWSDMIRRWHDNWLDILTPEIAPCARLLRALRGRGMPVFALSNFGAESFEIARKHYPVLSEFDRAYISGRMGVVKPDPQIYQMVEADCGLPPGALLFVDDRADNIAVAAGRGWQTHHFNGWQGWAKHLTVLGLLSESEAGL